MKGGKIWANSSFLHGTSYFIRFPVIRQDAPLDIKNSLHIPEQSKAVTENYGEMKTYNTKKFGRLISPGRGAVNIKVNNPA